MRYYDYDMIRTLPEKMQSVLEKYFPTREFGVSLVLANLAGDIDLVSIDRCNDIDSRTTNWSHYANLQRTDNGLWEVNEQFKGNNEQEMWIYGYYKSFGAAVRNLATRGTNNRKPIKIY